MKDKKLDLFIYLDCAGHSRGFVFLSDGCTTLYEQVSFQSLASHVYFWQGEYTLHLLEYNGKQVKFTQIYGKEQDLEMLIDDVQIIVWVELLVNHDLH